MIIYSEEESITKPFGIKKLDGTRDINFKLPHIAVGVFSEYLLDDIVAKFGCEKVGVISCANCQRPVYVMKYKDMKITLFLAGVSGPWISADIEELNVNGVNTFIIFGNCGVLDKSIEDCLKKCYRKIVMIMLRELPGQQMGFIEKPERRWRCLRKKGLFVLKWKEHLLQQFVSIRN